MSIALAVLDVFRYHDSVEVYRVARDEGIGHLVVGVMDDDAHTLPLHIHLRDGWKDRALINGQWEVIASSIANEDSLDPHNVFEDLLLARIAVDIEADALVTERSWLLNGKRRLVQEANPISPVQALGLLGLFLRSRGDYTWLRSEGGKFTYNRGLMYWVATRELLDSSWRWFSACVSHARATGDEQLMVLGQSTLQRYDRVLRSRDSIHQMLLVPQNNDTADDAMANLDVLLVFLCGAYDAAARVANIVCNVNVPVHGVSWRRDAWVKQLSAHCPQLAILVKKGSRYADVLDIVFLLRHSVHGEILRAVAFEDKQRDWGRETIVRLNHSEFQTVIGAMERNGGRPMWGVRELLPDAAGLDPGVFVEEVILQATEVLNELMKATPVEWLSLSANAPIQTGPPTVDESPFTGSPFSNLSRGSVRRLFGL